MNVLHVVHADVWGGGETAALSMCKALKKNGENVYVVVSGNIDLLQEKFRHIGNVTAVHISWGRVITCLREIRRIVVDNKIDIIHTHTGKVIPFVLLANWKLKSKVIAYRHNALKNKKDIIHKIIYKNLDAMVCVSNFVKKHQEIDMPKWLRDKLYVVNNGIEVNEAVSDISNCHNRFVVGYAGRIEENKGLLYLAKALVYLDNREVILIIAGDDNTEYAGQVKAYLQENNFGNNVRWLGYIPDMNNFYNQIDLLVAPSVVPEAFGLSICEAMYHGKPVITSNNGAQDEIIDDGVEGFLLQPGDEKGIAEKIMALNHNHNKCVIMGEKAREKIKKQFTMDCWLKEMLKVYNKVMLDKR